MLTNLIKFLDPSVKHWDDKKESTGMTPFFIQIVLLMILKIAL
ncbi:MAG: hypothetical protein ACEY3L_04720 [Wolbachia sp.]